ncbi:MAG: multiheme c-type cytochrome, partial [Acidobacteriota bacterium]|nr:multiheme c-type cytochrome [Acidobacteriota bacterium]
VEIGNFMERLGPDRAVKNEWLWKGMELLEIEVFNIGGNDVEELQALGVELGRNGRFISANLLSDPSGDPLLDPYVIKTLPPAPSAPALRVGFIGFAVSKHSSGSGASYRWENPSKSAGKWLPELREKCDYVIALACMPLGDAIQLAIDHKGIDMILNGFEHQSAMPPIKISRSTIVYAEDEAKSLGELRFSLKSGRAAVQPLNHRLTRRVADDPEIAAFMVKAKADISARQTEMALQTAQADGHGHDHHGHHHDHGHSHSHGSHQAHADSNFVTSQTCATCHAEAFRIWEGSAHAHAIDILIRERKEFDTQCVICHVTGSGQPGGFQDLLRTAHLANVQCEACHGQGREHSQQPTEFKMEPLGPNSCVSCHNPSNSPEFEFVSYWEAIKH